MRQQVYTNNTNNHTSFHLQWKALELQMSSKKKKKKKKKKTTFELKKSVSGDNQSEKI